MTTTWTDNFTRANESPLAAPWTTGSPGSGDSGLRLVSNHCVRNATTDGSAYYSTGTTLTVGQTSEITVSTVGGGDIGVFCRLQTGTGASYVGFWDGTIYRTTGFTSFVALTASLTTFSAGDKLKLGVSSTSPTTLTLYKNSVSVGSTTDSTAGLQVTGVFGIYTLAPGTDQVSLWTGTDDSVAVAAALYVAPLPMRLIRHSGRYV